MLWLVLLTGCGEAKPAETVDEVEWFELATGKACAQASVACGAGNCAANIDNRCKTPVTCQLSIECLCRTRTGEEGPATSSSQDTILSGELGGIATAVVCNDGDVLATLARTISCF